MIILLWSPCSVPLKGLLNTLAAFWILSKRLDTLNSYFPWYNTEHLHSGIDYVTPDQCHLGLRDQIVSRRKNDLKNQRLFRKKVNRQKQNLLTQNLKTINS